MIRDRVGSWRDDTSEPKSYTINGTTKAFSAAKANYWCEFGMAAQDYLRYAANKTLARPPYHPTLVPNYGDVILNFTILPRSATLTDPRSHTLSQTATRDPSGTGASKTKPGSVTRTGTWVPPPVYVARSVRTLTTIAAWIALLGAAVVPPLDVVTHQAAAALELLSCPPTNPADRRFFLLSFWALQPATNFSYASGTVIAHTVIAIAIAIISSVGLWVTGVDPVKFHWKSIAGTAVWVLSFGVLTNATLLIFREENLHRVVAIVGGFIFAFLFPAYALYIGHAVRQLSGQYRSTHRSTCFGSAGHGARQM